MSLDEGGEGRKRLLQYEPDTVGTGKTGWFAVKRGGVRIATVQVVSRKVSYQSVTGLSLDNSLSTREVLELSGIMMQIQDGNFEPDPITPDPPTAVPVAVAPTAV